ncbi:hypothetical protein A3N63_05925 [Klebsiella aerogenes]|nr:hypothetical protein A3N63_05925 [Klebsiella aerogenes]
MAGALIKMKLPAERTTLCPMAAIVFLRPFPLNAHSCHCLAHFSIWLEKRKETTHNKDVEKSLEKQRK